MPGAEHVPEVADPDRSLRGCGFRVRVVVVERVVAVGPQHDRAGFVEHRLRVNDPHQVDHPQVPPPLVPGAVVVHGAGFAIGDGAGVDLGLGAQPVIGQPEAVLLGVRETSQAVCPFLQGAGVGQIVEQLVGRAVDEVVDRAVLAEHLVMRIDRVNHLHEDRSRLLPRRRLDAHQSRNRVGATVVCGDVLERGQCHQLLPGSKKVL